MTHFGLQTFVEANAKCALLLTANKDYISQFGFYGLGNTKTMALYFGNGLHQLETDLDRNVQIISILPFGNNQTKESDKHMVMDLFLDIRTV